MMTFRSFAVALTTLLLVSCSRPDASADEARPAGGIAFSAASFDEALSRARNEKRIVLVDVYTDWCGWCKKLDREVFSDGKVADAAKGLVAVRVNAEKGGEEVARRYSVEGFPTILFVDGSGNVVKRINGYVDAAEMLRVISALPKA